ncbi:uncharacterized protein ARB_05835 [Trichophyton benhamiae CBS 112371]|uniref:Uncharacterized protein n=1 Tax=Arthroderma benhamiae (strain ATCC MYA-4681 / CBS 112371) TaxID=663331 RepID=D4ANL9_ARTBC|nr:uncharacterized protein ARB_05835 [Trichophyton benhamiae CBS 112371]EFE34880.1 hypothetical protein ARB_05835 [Trichophyton benhamiae CBS 112371]
MSSQLPRKLSVSSPGILYYLAITGLQAIAACYNLDIPRDELKEILHQLPEGADACLQVIVCQINANFAPDSPPDDGIIQIMSGEVGSEERDMVLEDTLQVWKAKIKLDKTKKEFITRFDTIRNIFLKLKKVYTLAEVPAKFLFFTSQTSNLICSDDYIPELSALPLCAETAPKPVIVKNRGKKRHRLVSSLSLQWGIKDCDCPCKRGNTHSSVLYVFVSTIVHTSDPN